MGAEKITTERVTTSECGDRILVSLETWEGYAHKTHRFVATLSTIGVPLRSDHTPIVRNLRKYIMEHYNE